MNQANWERAEGLLEDIKFGNPQYANRLMKQHGKKGTIKFLKEFLDNNDRTRENLTKTLLEQMPKTHDPMKYRVNELRAKELAKEMAYEEVRALYNPPQEQSEEAQEFLNLLRM